MVDVDINYDLKKAEIKCPKKTNAVYTVTTAPGGFIFYEVHTNAKAVPKPLSGRYTSLDGAVEAVTKYIESRPMTPAVERDYKAAKREERKNAAADHTEGSK
jgi:hypothetical protein